MGDRKETEEASPESTLLETGAVTKPTSYGGRAFADAASLEQAEAEIPDKWSGGDVILGLYEVIELVGEGGMGEVFRVQHREWNLELAVKCPKTEIFSDAEGRDGFTREAETWVNLGTHPHIVSCYYVRTLGGIPRIFAEYVEGGCLLDWIGKDVEPGRLYDGGKKEALKRILDVGIQVAWGLHFAHEQGLVHQDVKPANVMMTTDGLAKVTDFGLASARAEAGEGESSVIDRSESVSKLPYSFLVSFGGGFTPAYCSPEQMEAHQQGKAGTSKEKRTRLTRRTDIWSWAVSMLQMFTGELTWATGVAAEKALEACIEDGPAYSMIPEMPKPVALLLKECFAWNPAERPSSLNELAEKLQTVYEATAGSVYKRYLPDEIRAKASGMNNRALSMLDLGKSEQAVVCFQEALNIFPHHLETVYNKELLLWREAERRDVDVVTRLESLNTLVEDGARREYLLAQIFIERGDARNALIALRKALELQPSVGEFWKRLGETYLYLSELAPALEATQKALEILPKDSQALDLCRKLQFSEEVLREYSERCWHELDLEHTFAFEKEHLAFHPNTQRVLVKSPHENDLAVANIFDHSPISELPGENIGLIHYASFAADGQSLVLLEMESARVWSIEKDKWLKTIPISGSWGIDVTAPPVLCPDGTILLARASTRHEHPSIYVCPPDRPEFLRLCIEPGRNIVSLDVDLVDRRILTASRDGTCRMRSLDTGFGRSVHYNQRGLTFAAFADDRKMFITCSRDGVTTVWHRNEVGETQVREIVTHPDFAVAASITPNQSFLATLNITWERDRGRSEFGQVHVWDMVSGRCLRTLTDVNSQYKPRLYFSPDEKLLFVLSSEGGLRVWRLPRDLPKARYEISRPHTAYELTSAAMRAESLIRKAQGLFENGETQRVYQLLRSVQEDADYIFDPRIVNLLRSLHKKGKRKKIENHRCLQIVEVEHRTPVTVLRFLNEGTALSGTANGSLQIWDLKAPACQGVLRGHTKRISAIIPSSSGEIVVTFDRANHMRAWDVHREICISYFDCSKFNDISQHLTISPNGTKAFSISKNKVTIVWDLELEEIDDYFDSPLDKDLIRAVFSVEDDSTVFLELEGHSWLRLDLQTRGCEPTQPPFPGLDSAQQEMPEVVIMEDAVSLRNRQTRKDLLTIRGHEERVLSFDVSGDARYVISGDEGGTIRLWELDWELEFD